jgi:hypothetical protein
MRETFIIKKRKNKSSTQQRKKLQKSLVRNFRQQHQHYQHDEMSF